MIPLPTQLDIATDNQQAAVKEIVTAKYTDAGNWMQYGASLLDNYIADVKDALLGADTVSTDLADVRTALSAIDLYTPPAAFAYTRPVSPTYDNVPTYAAPTLGTITAVPTVTAVLDALQTVPTIDATLGQIVTIPSITAVLGDLTTVPAITASIGNILTVPSVDVIAVEGAPSTDVAFTNSTFSDSLESALRGKLSNDLLTSSTGLDDAEAGMFARAVARENDILAEAYTQATTTFSSRGFDMPPGALNALQTQESNKSVIRLTDVNTGILAESAKLAVDYNKTTISASTQLLDIVSRLFDNRIVRDFEAAKTKVQYAIEGFKQTISVALAKADLNKAAITATLATNEGTVNIYGKTIAAQVAMISGAVATNDGILKAYTGLIAGETASINAAVSTNEGVVNTYKATVEGQASMVNAVVSANDGIVKAYTGKVQGEVAAINGVVAANQGTVETFKAEIDGQVSPMKAISDVNQSKAQAFGAEVQAETSNLNAQVIPEELKLKGVQANASIASTKAEIALKEAMTVIENARRQLELEVQTIMSLAQGAQQIIAGALNSVSVSSSFGFGGTVQSSYGVSNILKDEYGGANPHANPSVAHIT